MSEETQTHTLSAVWRYFATCRNATPKDRRNARRALWWLLAWAVSFVAVSFGLKEAWMSGSVARYAAVSLSIVIGLVAVLAYVRLVREADELQRKIQLEAMALGFGGAFLGNFALALLQHAGLSVDPGDQFLVAVVFYMIGVILGASRYA